VILHKDGKSWLPSACTSYKELWRVVTMATRTGDWMMSRPADYKYDSTNETTFHARFETLVDEFDQADDTMAKAVSNPAAAVGPLNDWRRACVPMMLVTFFEVKSVKISERLQCLIFPFSDLWRLRTASRNSAGSLIYLRDGLSCCRSFYLRSRNKTEVSVYSP
jgi:hypothetical protein